MCVGTLVCRLDVEIRWYLSLCHILMQGLLLNLELTIQPACSGDAASDFQVLGLQMDNYIHPSQRF